MVIATDVCSSSMKKKMVIAILHAIDSVLKFKYNEYTVFNRLCVYNKPTKIIFNMCLILYGYTIPPYNIILSAFN